jgi:hypothetical protein
VICVTRRYGLYFIYNLGCLNFSTASVCPSQYPSTNIITEGQKGKGWVGLGSFRNRGVLERRAHSQFVLVL